MPGPNGRMAPAAAEPEGEEVPTLEIGMEDSIAAPNTTGRRGCMKDLKEGEEIRWKGLPPLGVHDEEGEEIRWKGLPPLGVHDEDDSAMKNSLKGSSSFSKACAMALQEQERLARQTSPAPALEEQTIEERERLARQTSPAPALEEQTIEERLHRLDLKMEKLSLQMTECVAGIRAVYLKRYRHIRPPPMTDTLIPVPEQHAQSSIRLAEGRDGREGSSARSSVGSNRSSLSVDGHDGTTSHQLRIAEAFHPENLRVDSRTRPTVRDVSGTSGGAHEHQEGDVERASSSAAQREMRHISEENAATRDASRSSQNSRQSISSWLAKRQRVQGSMSQKVWHFMENADSTLAAHLYSKVMPCFILMSVALGLAHAIAPAFLSGVRMVIAEITIETIFFLEISTRFLVCPNRWTFFGSTYNIIDIMSVMPLILRVGLNGGSGMGNDSRSWEYLVLIGFVPALRLLKTWRRFQQIHLLTKAFKLAFEALPVMLFIYIVVWLFFTAAMFVAEDRNDIQTLGQAMWLTFCSMTSSMFGDLYPKSDFGKVIISALVLISTLYMAIPIGIIGTCFSEVWADRDRILLVERMRRVFKQNGFTANDIPDLFSHFDVDCSGLLNLEEFKSMASILKLGLSEDRLLSLFNMFDDDGSGGIDEREFCRAIFPEAYCCLYGDRGLEKSNSFKNLRRLSVSLFQSFAGNGGN